MASLGKKVGIGCALVVVLMCVLCCAGGLFVGHKAKQFGASMQQYATQFATLDTKYPYVDSGVYTAPRLEDYFKARQDIVDFFRNDTGVQDLQAAMTGQKNPGLMAVASNAASLVSRAVTEISAVFDRYQMSPNEFAYLARHVHVGIITESAADEQIKDLQDSIRTAMDNAATALRNQGQPQFVVDYDTIADSLSANSPTVPAATVDAIRSHIEELKASPYMSYFEMFLMQERGMTIYDAAPTEAVEEPEIAE